jgi:flagellar hook-length control protein FliK
MTTAATIGVTSPGSATQGAAGTAADEAGADFTAALAEAVAPAAAGNADAAAPVKAEDTQTVLPDGTQSDAALAWMAGMLNEIRLPEAPVPVAAGAVDGTLAASLGEGAQVVASGVASPPSTKAAGTKAAAGANAQPLADAVAAMFETDAAPAADAMDIVSRMLANFSDRAPTHAGAEVEFDPLQPATGNALYTQTREALVNPAGAQTTFADTLRSAVGSPRWGEELGSRLVMMSTRGQQEGSLSLSPEHLGPLEVRISVSQDGTNVWFGAQHADTRAALTDALPRLREMFTAAGLALGQAGVSQEMPRQEARRSELAAAGFRSSAESDAVAATPVTGRVRAALLDAWA